MKRAADILWDVVVVLTHSGRDSESDSDSECLTSKVSLCGMQGQMHMPDPLHGILEASHTARFLSVVSLGRLARN